MRESHNPASTIQPRKVENKRLGHALSLIKAQQQVKHETKVQTNSEKLGYKKRPRNLCGPDYVQSAKAVEMTA